MWASRNGHLEIVRTLLEKGANIEAKDKVRRTLMIVEMMMVMTVKIMMMTTMTAMIMI